MSDVVNSVVVYMAWPGRLNSKIKSSNAKGHLFMHERALN